MLEIETIRKNIEKVIKNGRFKCFGELEPELLDSISKCNFPIIFCTIFEKLFSILRALPQRPPRAGFPSEPFFDSSLYFPRQNNGRKEVEIL